MIEHLDLHIREGERLILLGPSGCGKSTTLRMIAGLETISSGELVMEGKCVNDVPAGKRGVSMVFQNYALYPHMTVRDNICYALKAHKEEKEEIEKRLQMVLKNFRTGNLCEPEAKRVIRRTKATRRTRARIGKALSLSALGRASVEPGRPAPFTGA